MKLHKRTLHSMYVLALISPPLFPPPPVAEVSVSQCSELIFNTLALLNNLTYYCSDVMLSGHLPAHDITLCQVCKLVHHQNFYF